MEEEQQPSGLPSPINRSRTSATPRGRKVGNFLLVILVGVGLAIGVHWLLIGVVLKDSVTIRLINVVTTRETGTSEENLAGHADAAKAFGNDFLFSRTAKRLESNKYPVVAYVVSITDCSGSTKSQDDLVDAASVLKHSIHLASIQTPASQSRYDYQMYAFLHKSIQKECASIATALDEIGYKVEWKPTPFSLEDISDDNENAAFFKDKVHNQGCCGERELIKLFSLRLVQHPIAVHLDLDTLLFRPVDHLYNAMLDPSNQAARQLVQAHQQSHNGHQSTSSNDADQAQQPLPKEIIAYFTRDYNLAVPGIKPTRVLMQGGFWVLRPNVTIYDELIALIVRHTHRFSKDCGWGGCSIGSARLYGGAGFQGLLSYFYSFVQGRDTTVLAAPKVSAQGELRIPKLTANNSNFVELNRCIYNSMADQPRKGCSKGDFVACDSCNEVPLENVYGAHFTLCQKPWNYCEPFRGDGQKRLCPDFHKIWQTIRSDFEASRLVVNGNRDDSGTSHLLTFTRRCADKLGKESK